MRITLLKAAQVPLGGPIRPSGFTATVDDETFASLKRRSLVAQDDGPDSPEDDNSAEPGQDTDPDDVQDSSQDDGPDSPEDEPELVKDSSVKLPPMTAPLAVWKETADKLGIKTTSMKKPEIIGAVKEFLSQQ